MIHNYINLNQIKSNPDGQPTVNRQSRLMSYRGNLRNLAMIFAVLVMSIANIGMAWGVDYKPYLAEGFEGTTTLTGSSCTANNTTATANATSRTGSRVCYAYPSSASSTARYVGVGSNKTADKNWYIHAIVWVKGDNVASDKVQHQIGPYGTSPATPYVNTTTSYTRCTITPLKSGGSAKQIRLYFKSNNGTPVAHFWYDDFIMYLSSEEVDTDTIKPSSATSASATTSSISWTNGSDTGEGATGIQATLIFHRTGGSVGGNDLTLNDQGLYSLTATEGPKVVGNWTLLSASVDAAATSYSGTFEAGHEYAIVHRDLAYNYSTPTYVTVAAPPACGETAQAALTLSSNSGTICGTGTTTFTVSGGSGTGALSVSSSDESKATASIEGSTVTVTGVAAGSATITVTKACDATYAEATADYSVTVNSVPTANAGVDKTTEPDNGVALAATAAADGCTGAWTIVSGPNTSTAQLSSTSSATATFIPTVAGTYTLRWTVTNTSSNCSAYDEMKVTAATCAISSCGNATITYAINGGSSGDHSEGGADLISSATASNTTALGASTTVGYTGISMSSLAKKAAAATSACYPTKPNMSGKIGVYNGAAYNSSNYLQFAFTVKTGYTFTPCDIEFTVQPVDVATNFRWEVTDGTNVYGYGTATDVPKGSDGGASVLTGLTSTAEMAAGTYYIRLYPYVNAASKTFRISNDVILKGTTASAAPSCTAPTDLAISGEYVHFPGETLTLTVSGDNIAQDATYTWKKGDQVIAGQTTATLTINSCEITDAGNYTCTISNGGSCEATANYTVKMYSLRGLTDNNWTTDFVFTKVNATTATYSMELTGSSSYDFKVYDGSAYYGNTGGNPTMTSDNCTNWTMQENMGNNVTLQTTAAGTYTFTLDYTNASNPTISVTYPAKRIVYLNPGVWYTGENQEKFVVHAWYGSTAEDILMTKIDDCNNRNIYFAEIDAAHTHVIFIRGNKDSYDISNPWNNVWNQTGDLTIDNVQYNIGSEWNFSKALWTSFTPNYIVTFDANGHGTAPDAQCVAKNGKATTPAAPTATGYTFGGWYKEAGCINAWNFANDVVTENITLYAKWTANNYTITYNENRPTNAWNAAFAVKNIPAEQTLTGGTGTVSNNTPTITEDESSEYAIYTFNNWNTAADGKGTSYAAGAAITITENTTLYAQWTPRTYTITYYDTDKTTVLDLEPKNYTYGTGVASLPTPTKDGYTFSSWTKWWNDGEESNVSSISNTTWGDANLAAQWTCTTPTISTQPINATYTQNTAAAALSVTATANDGTLSYQWQSSTDNSNFTNISGATGNEYTPSTTEVGTTYYRCVVTNTTGSCIVTSASATITVTAASVEPDPEPEAVPQVGTFTGAGTSGMVNLYWTMPTKPVTTTVDIASATLSAAEGQSAGATSTITKENTNEIKVVYSTNDEWQATGVKIPLATPKTNVESITFEYKSDPSQNVDFIPFLYDGTRWVESDFVQLTPTEWTSHTSVITQEAWNNSNIYSTDKTILSVNFYANPGTVVENGTFYIRNVVLNRGTQVAASGLIIVRKEGSNPTSPTDTDGTIVYNGDGIAATCTDDGLENGTTYHYAAYAHDGQGNYSEPLYWQYTYTEGLNTYAPDDTDFPNPERGFYEQVQWNANKGYEAVIGDSYFDDARAASRSLILRIYYMDSETLRTNQQLPEDFIKMFNADMAKFRTNGMKCILRFAYDENSGDGYQDASPETWATHLAQLKTHLENNADVIYVVQAGFLGVWGEWYYSSQGTGNAILPNTKNNLIDQLLDAVPANRCVQLRTPKFKRDYLGNNNPLTSAVAYKGTAQARLGHHNDAFLNGEQNQGTYENRATDMAYIAQECLYVPIGGETNLEESQVDDLYEAYCKGTVAEAEMAQLHYSYLNYSYSTVVTNRWKAEGSYARMSKYMGYRFELASASLPNEATAGTQMNVQLNIKNVGYAPLYNERHAYIVFKNNTNTYSIQLSSDPRTWAPNSAVTPIDENIALPADMVAGTYDMYLHLPDASASIANNPKYAVRFANQGIWESETGYNKLNKQVVVTATDLATYTITYDLNGGTGTLPTQAATTAGGTFTLASSNNINKSGYTFAGWSDGTDTYAAGAIYTMPAKNVTLTAQWTANQYNITYKDQGGADFSGTHAADKPTQHTYGTETELKSPTKTGYTFGGWYTSPDCSTGLVTSLGATAYTADITLYAKWTAVPTPAGDCGEIIKSTFSGTKQSAVSTTTFNTTGTIGGTSTSYLIGDDGKLNKEGAYLILKLSTGTFLEGDTIKIKSNKSGGVKFATGTVSTQTYTPIGTASTATSGEQLYYFVLAANADSIIVPRGASESDYNQNPEIEYVSVRRPCPECDATPAAPTSPTNGETTSNSQAVSWTDASNDAWEVYVSTSSSTPDAGQSPTAEPTTVSYTFTGLTASTEYHWWVRSVCDDTHKSDWVAGTSFETSAASTYTLTASATVSNPMTADSKTGAITGSFTNNPVTDITSGTTTSTLSNTFTVNKGTPVTVTAAATIAGTAAQCDECTYVFDSWENIPASVTADVSTIHAIYKTTYSISFKETDESAVAGVSGTSYEYGVGKAASTLPTPTKSGYTFGGWYNENTLTTPAADIDDGAWGNITYYAKWTAAASQTALVINTLYEVPDMIPSGATLTDDDQFFEGLSANTKFELIGSASSSTTPKANSKSTNDKTIDGIPFDDGSMWFKGNANLTSKIPTTYALSFIVPEGGGKLYLYFSGTSTNITLAKSGEEGSKPSCASGYGEVDVTAGTYYLYGTGTTAPYCFYGLKLCSTYSVTITPTNVTKETGATGAGAAIHGKAYTATFTAKTGYTLPSDVTVSIGGTPQTKGSGYTWTISDGTATLTIPAAKVTGAISITVTGVAAESYSITYHCNGAESGCPSNVAATTNLPSPLPTGLTRDGYTFGGWFTDSECTVAAVAGATLTGNADLYAKWTERGSECEDTPHAWDVIATSAKSYKVRISKVTEEVAIPIADATASNLTAYAGTTSSTSDNVTVQIADGGSSKYGYKFDGGNTYLKLVFSTPLVLNDTLVVGMTNASHNISFTTTAVRATTLSTSGGKLIIPAALAGQSTIYLWRGSGTTMYLRSFAVKHECEAIPSCTTPVLSDLEDQKVCPGSDVTWTANNTEALQDGETIAYQWNKKGNNTVLSSNATLTLNDVTEATGGTYVVTAIVSADGKASKTASKEVTLTVTPATATPTITANANTIYTGNDVTLTASCASSGVGYQWYTCTDAEGTNPQAIGGETNATYTLTAGEAGTYYYKVIVTGDGTHSCGTAEKVYTLIVSASNSGETTCGDITGQFTNGAYIFDKDFIIYGINSGGNLDLGASSTQGNNRCGGKGSFLSRQRFAVTFPVDVLSFSFIGYQSNLRTVKAVETTTDLKTADTEYTTITHTAEVSQEGDCQTHVITPETAIPANTFVWVELNNGLNLSEICYVPVSNVDCTDPQVIATVDNATVCEDTENVTFTATNYADGAEFQWQKKNGNTWEIISGATSATYTISPVTTGHAGQYRVIATKEECSRTSEELTLTVLTAPEFNAFANTASVMKGNALTINDVEATNATSYAWYKSADATYDAGTDTKVGTTKELLLAASSITEEADQAFYLFCVASNSCGSVTSNAITVTVTPFVEEECATAGNEGEHEFGFDEDTECSLDTYGDSKTPVWKTNSRSKYLTYTAPKGKYFATAKVTVAHTGGTTCGYAYSTDGGTTWVVAELEGLSATLNAITIELPANVNAFRISRNLTAQDGEKGSDSGNFYLAEACFTYENACTPTSVTPTTTSYEYNISTPADFEEPPFTVKHGEDIVNDAVLTYTSSNPAIATVDEEGSVTFEGMTGTVTITAAYAGTTIDEIEYCASEGSYTITVVCQDEEPKIIAATSTNLDGCNNSITLEAKMQDGNSFTGGTFQWYRDGEAIDGATSASYEVVRAGTYTVSRTYTCTTMSSKPAVVTNENPEPKVERLTPFQYYHVDKDYSDQMKDRHLFAVTSYGTSDGKRYHLTATRNGEALELSSSTAFSTIPSSDNAVDTVMIDLNELEGKYNANDEIVITCAPIDNCNQVSTITSSITIHVIDQTPTLALICSGSSKAGGTRKTGELTVGGDFLTGYNVADLYQQTGNQTFDPNTEWGFYTELQKEYRVTPVNGYAQFNKLNYEPFDILLLTDYPKSSKSEAAQKIIDDMADLCDYRPLLSFKTHFQSDKWKDKTTGEYKYTKWVKKGFTTAPVVPKQTATYVNIVCYAHPMFEGIDNTNDQYTFHDDDDPNQLVYQVLTGPGYEGDKGIQGFELADADNFVTIGLVHYNAQANKVTHDDHTHISWNAEANDRLLVAMAERQTNIEARMMLFSLNCGAQSLQTPGGRNVILQCLKYLLETDPLEVADCRMTFDNGAGNTDFDPGNYEGTGTRGDGLWSTAANWGPDYLVVPGRNNDVRIAAPCIVDGVKTKVSVGNEVQETIQYYPEVLSIHITENGSLTIPANSSLTARSTILRADENGNVYPTNVADISLGSNAGGNASLILNNERGDTKAGVAMYSTAKADTDTYSAEASTWQYIGTPHSDVANAIYNYYDSWLYQYDTGTEGWVVIPNGGPLVPFRGYCVTHPESLHTYWMEGTLVSTTNQDISIPANRFVVVANSWTAPIQINELTDDDMEGLTDKSIYFFNTGSDPNQAGELNQENGRYAAGTYVSVPIRSAPYTGDSVIPSMQGFYVVGGNADGTLHLDYERHVRAKRENVPSGPMHAPARIADTDNEPQVAKFLFRGTRYDDRLIILERPDFTRGYDSGWDGEQWGGNAAAPMSYVVTETRWDAVSAIPEYEGTVIAFRAGEDSEYTIHFDYDGMEEALYLLDTETKIYTRVLKGNSYTFTCTDKAEHNRFILTRKAPQIATGVGNVSGDEVQGTKAKKLLIEDKMFIMVNGVLYDATGKVVK